jgi:hypothetical protein
VEAEQILWQRLFGRGEVLSPPGRDGRAPTCVDRAQQRLSGRGEVLSSPGRDDRVPTCLVVSHRRAVLERSEEMRRLCAMGVPSPEIDPPA